MNGHTIFVISAAIGFIGWIGFFIENLSGRMTHYTRWKDMTNRQWVFCYAMVQFAAVIVVAVLYQVARSFG